MKRCFYCGANLSNKNIQYDHFPNPASTGGTQTVASCITCHDMKDRFPIDTWSEGWEEKIIADMNRFSPETKIFLAEAMSLFQNAIKEAKHPAASRSPVTNNPGGH